MYSNPHAPDITACMCLALWFVNRAREWYPAVSLHRSSGMSLEILHLDARGFSEDDRLDGMRWCCAGGRVVSRMQCGVGMKTVWGE
jgi:hypothetical protein